ncbi:galanin receptor type 2-like [Paramacrobiotus metropolitanus]|uniref:galanin receptor type 2-like n=1 Tax=Paramacrobiotus metropolitanus TaxID=2943436 RepID=UPI0024456596|nr:galanin receptor type 2-like [Paramacrobiotus metropolitanus]
MESFVMANNSSEIKYEWNGSTTSLVIFTVLTLLMNGYILLLFAIKRTLHTPFAVYLISLLCANIFQTFADLLNLLTYTRQRWYFTSFLCSVAIYSEWVGGAAVLHSHLTITLNRIWASTFPIHYRNYHSIRTAVLFCLLMLGYCHLLTGPLLLIDYLYYRPGMANATECTIAMDAQPQYAGFVDVWVYVVPMLVMLLSYPYLLWKRKQLGKVTESPAVTNGGVPNGKATADSSHGFRVLTALTGSIVICWAPEKIYWMLLAFWGVDVTVLKEAANLMYSVQTVLDPLLFAVALKDLKVVIIAQWRTAFLLCYGRRPR